MKFVKIVRNYLETKKIVDSIPLDYIMHKSNELGQARIVYATELESAVLATPFEGHTFEAGNGRVFLVLKGLTIKGSSYVIINH
jgi:hypothetical protein